MEDATVMVDHPLPVFPRRDYDLFHETVTGLPNTYSKWLDAHRQEERRLILLGETPVDVIVTPSDYANFCHERHRGRSLKTLEDFAVEMAARTTGRKT
jgi:hypothetical protein